MNLLNLEKLIITENNNLENEDVRTLVLRPKEPKLMLVAFEKSWIRLKDQNGDIYLKETKDRIYNTNRTFSGSLSRNATKVSLFLMETFMGH